MWILAGLPSSCASSGKRFTLRSVPQWQPTSATLALFRLAGVPFPAPGAKAELQVREGSEFLNPSILLSLPMTHLCRAQTSCLQFLGGRRAVGHVTSTRLV